ncbi:MAG: hypothetical protein Q8K65_10145 [Alphaproteobacteria bacterium]|nr:hypothetical protein [Alphaproteobacteria bacterium]
MFSQIIAPFRQSAATVSGVSIETRRSHGRRRDGAAQVVIAGKSFAVRDWSEAGVRFAAPQDESNMAGIYFEAQPMPAMQPGDVVTVMMTFRVMDETLRIPVEARILRRSSDGIVARFVSLSTPARRQFQRVKDLLNAEAFLISQQPIAGYRA